MTNRKWEAEHAKPTKVQCAIYTRKSTDEGLDNDFNTLDAQREAAEAYVASQKHEGWTCLPDRYDDGGFSGGTMDRPALKRLLAAVEAGEVDCVVVYKVDRLSRSLLDFARIMGTLDQHGASFVSVTQQFNTTSSMGRLTLNILLSFAQFEREIISERTRDKMSAARKKGKWVGGMPVLGYDVDPATKRLVVNRREAEQVRAIFDLYVKNESLQGTVREMNRQGWTTKRWTTKTGCERGGRPFDKTRLANLLTNVTYVGNVNHRGTIYPGEHEAIVDEAVWERVHKLMRRNGSAGGRASRNKYGALLRGLLWCAPCEAAMIHSFTRKGQRRYRYYVCGRAQRQGWQTCPTKSIPAPEVERFVVDQVRRIGTDRKLQREVLRQIRASEKARLGDLDREQRLIAKDLKRWSAEVKRVVGSAPRERRGKSTVPRLTDLQERIEAAEASLAQIHDAKTALERNRVDESDLTAALASFKSVWETLSPREQTRIVQLLVERAAYNGVRGEIAITFRPSGVTNLCQGY